MCRVKSVFHCRGNRSTWREPTQTGGLYTERPFSTRELNPGPSCCETTVLPRLRWVVAEAQNMAKEKNF